MIFDLARSARDLLRADAVRTVGPDSLIGRLTDLMFYGDFEIFEQVASISEVDHTNIVGYRAGSAGGGGLLLSAPLGAHVDGNGVVGEAPAPALREGRVWGAGASSGRLALLCQLTAAASFKRDELRRPVVVAGTFGHEHRGSGTRFLLESGQFQPEWVVVGASTNLELVRAHRGYLLFQIDLAERGEPWRSGFPVRSSYHVVLPEEAPSCAPWGRKGGAFDRGLSLTERLVAQGGTSIHGLAAGEAVNRVPRRCAFDVLSTDEQPPDLPWDLEISPLGDDAAVSVPLQGCLAAWRRLRALIDEGLAAADGVAGEFEPAGPLLNVGRVATTSTGLQLSLDCRPLPGEDPYALYQIVEHAAARLMDETDGQFEVGVEATINRPAMDLPLDSPVTRAGCDALRQAGLLPVTSTLPFYTDGAMYASCGLDTVVIGPGWWGDAASADEESIPVSHLELAVEVYRGLIRELCV